MEDEGRRGSRATRNVLQRRHSRRVPRHIDAVLPRFGSSSKPARLNERSTSALVTGIPSSATTSSDSGPERADQNYIGSSTCLAFWLSMLT